MNIIVTIQSEDGSWASVGEGATPDEAYASAKEALVKLSQNLDMLADSPPEPVPVREMPNDDLLWNYLGGLPAGLRDVDGVGEVYEMFQEKVKRDGLGAHTQSAIIAELDRRRRKSSH